jgi:hypothetical protein
MFNCSVLVTVLFVVAGTVITVAGLIVMAGVLVMVVS